MYNIQAIRRPDNGYYSPAIDQTLIASIIAIKQEDAIDVAKNYLNEITQYVLDRKRNVNYPLIQYFYPNDPACQQFMFQTFKKLGVLIETWRHKKSINTLHTFTYNN